VKKITLQLLVLFFYIESSAQAQLTNSGNFCLLSGASITFFGNFNNSGTFTDSGQVVNFNGAAAQIISGTSPTVFNNLVINNASGVSLQQSISVTNSIALTSGPLQLNSNILTVNKNTGAAVTRTSGYIVSEQTNNSGKIKWNIGTNTSAHEFPFGTIGGIYIPFVLTLTAGNIGNATVATYPTGTNNLPYPSNPVVVTNVNDINGIDNSANTVDRFWQIDKDGPSGTATMKFTATSAETGTITGLLAQRWNTVTSGWDQPIAGQSSTSTSATVSGVTNFSPWTLSGNGSPLPIGLLYFTATPVNNSYVDLRWATGSETNNDFFTVEKTYDGVNFETVAIVDGAGNSTQTLHYSTRDNQPYNGVSYYRLKQTDFNGLFSCSPFASVEITKNIVFDLTVFPNPSSGPVNISINGAEDDSLLLIITDISGRITYSKTIIPANEEYTFSIENNEELTSGIYIITLIGKNNKNSRKLIVE
jgi:hypothetical protein